MSDANKQSVVEKCKYRHDWHKLPEHGFVCGKCYFRPANDSKLFKEAEAILHLREILKPGDTVYTVLRHVSRSGMSRNIDLYYIAPKDSLLNKCEAVPVWISSYVGNAIGQPQSRRNWERSQGLTVGGCGMDMGFHLVYNLSRVLFPNGFVCKGDNCGSNDHSNDRKPYRFNRADFKGQMHIGDGGYALRHEWL